MLWTWEDEEMRREEAGKAIRLDEGRRERGLVDGDEDEDEDEGTKVGSAIGGWA